MNKSHFFPHIDIEEAKKSRGVENIKRDALLPASVVNQDSFLESPETVNHCRISVGI
jgi:hypothetical protein